METELAAYEDPLEVEIGNETDVVMTVEDAEADDENDEDEKENGEGLLQDDFEDEECLEITRRRVSQDREGSCYWYDIIFAFVRRIGITFINS